MMNKSIRVVFLGGSGYVGSEVIKNLLDCQHITQILMVSRRQLPDFEKKSSKIKVKVVNPLQNIAKIQFNNYQIAFMTLGYGKSRKNSKQQILRVDAQIPGIFAQVCKKSGIQYYSLLTACGADINSQYGCCMRTYAGGGWYNHVKGVCQHKTRQNNFRFLNILRPAGIIGNPNTGCFNYIGPLFDCCLPSKYKSIQLEQLGFVMATKVVKAYLNNQEGEIIYQGENLHEAKLERKKKKNQ